MSMKILANRKKIEKKKKYYNHRTNIQAKSSLLLQVASWLMYTVHLHYQKFKHYIYLYYYTGTHDTS